MKDKSLLAFFAFLGWASSFISMRLETIASSMVLAFILLPIIIFLCSLLLVRRNMQSMSWLIGFQFAFSFFLFFAGTVCFVGLLLVKGGL